MERGTNTQRAGGLEGIEVADTVLSHVDGQGGRLIIRGLEVEALAQRVGFEGAHHLLHQGTLPDEEATVAVRARLAAGRGAAFELLPRLGDALVAPAAMDALRSAVGHLPSDASAEAVVGAVPVFLAAWWQTREGQTPLAPDLRLSHAADLLRMTRGADAASEEVAALDAYLVTVIDHGLNASTFAARVVASTGSDRVSAAVAGLGALKGPLHGGAPGPVLDMLDAVGDAERAAVWIERELAAGRRIMGMGHRVYRVRDPRAEVLERAVERLGDALWARSAAGPAAGGGTSARQRLALARTVERTAEELLARRHPDRPLRANVEFFTAVLLEAVGLPRELFTAVFAASRISGWCAHFDEQQRTGRLIRPTARYLGPRG